jgi:NAD(P)-dependent dehydrogenase (short-subunit alcohol dehydrogenase family)
MTDILFPLWQVDRGAYDAVCAHLGLTPNAAIHARLNAYLALAPTRFAAPQVFSRFLAEPMLTRFRVARLDLATRLIDRSHPVRHVLNAVIALHECDADGYAQLSATPVGAALLPSLALWGTGFVAGLAVTLPWLGLQYLRFMLTAPLGGSGTLAGQRVLITGASSGLGLDLVLECLERGARVVAMVRSAASRERLLALLPPGMPTTILVANLSSPGAQLAALEQEGMDPGTIALAVLCAGVKHESSSVLSLDALRNTFEINFFAAAELARWLCTAGSSTPRQTRIVLVSSMGRWHGMHSSAGYNASKAALSIWGQSLEMELARAGRSQTTVSIVEPGIFESRMTRLAGMARLLFVPRRKLAARIVRGALAGQRSMRPPFWFAWLTWALCLAGRKWRVRLLGRVKPDQHEGW